MRTVTLLICSAVSALTACTSYSPDLPSEPFTCTMEAPNCPEGYTCKDGGGGRFVCTKPTAEVVDAGIDASNCANDNNLEPNNDTGHAFQTQIDQATLMIPYAGLAICPKEDVDVYSVVLTKSGTSTPSEDIEVTVTYHEGPALQAAILGSGGQTLKNASPMGSNTLKAAIVDLPNGQYYVKVFGPSTGTNNYELTIKTTP
jgi:hypothetical protein